MVPEADPRLQAYLSELVTEIEAQDRALADQSEALQKYEEVVQTLTQPANRIGTYVRAMDDGLAMVVQGDTEFVVTVNPEVAPESLIPGARVRLNEAYAIVAVVPTLPTGAAVRVAEVREDTLRVGADTQGEGGKFVLIGPQLGEADWPATGRVPHQQGRRSTPRCQRKDCGGAPAPSRDARLLPRRSAPHPLGSHWRARSGGRPDSGDAGVSAPPPRALRAV